MKFGWSEPVVNADFVPFQREIKANYGEGETLPVVLHDGSRVVLRKLDRAFDVSDATKAYAYVQEHLQRKEYLTGLLHFRPDGNDFHSLNGTPAGALNQVPVAKLVPGAKALEKLMARYA